MNRSEYNALDASNRNVGWAQNVEEVWSAISALNKIEVNNVLEIGVQGGQSMVMWDAVTGPNGKLLGVDLSDCTVGKVFNNELTMIVGRSEDPATIAKVKEHMPVIDFLFIDGHHYEDMPRRDWENYSPLVRSGGIIGFHDTRIVEIKNLFNSLPYRKENYDHQFGLGLVWKD